VSNPTFQEDKVNHQTQELAGAAGPPAVLATRARVMEAALDLFAEKGFAETTTRELAERLGFTKAALYYHFRTKDELLAALAEPGLGQLRVLVDGIDPSPDQDRRRALLAGYVDMVVSNGRLTQLMSRDPSIGHRPAFAAAGPLFAQLIRILAGTKSPGVAEQARARAALGGIHAALLYGSPADPENVLCAAALEAGCGALGIAGRPAG
jgi:AcrR family transcriptional regulator